MELRLCEKLNQKFIPHKPAKTIYTHQDAKAWSAIEKHLLSLSKALSTPKQIWVSYCFAESTPVITLSNAHENETDLTLQSIKNIIPKAENQGLKVEVDSEFKEITFTFTPSNY
jgi:hypothetical protein